MAKKVIVEGKTAAERAAEQAVALEKASSSAKKMVKFTYPADMGDPDGVIYVAVNGKSYRVMRGYEVTIPDYVAEVLQRQIDADNAAAKRRKYLSQHPFETDMG